MFLVELVMQGVRGFGALVRLRFQSGFNIVPAGNEAGKTTAVDTMLRLLFPSSGARGIEPLISRQTPEASRGALVVYSDDGAYYRVIQDFSKRGVNLSKYNAATKDFILMHKEWDGTAQFTAGLTAGVTEEEYGRLFILRREHYAGGAARPATRPSPAVSAKPAPMGKYAAQEAKLAQLREMLGKAEEAADAEYRLQSAKMKLGDTAKKLEALDELDGRSADIASKHAGLTGCETLPENLSDLLREHERNQSQKMARVEELTMEIEGLKSQLEDIPRQNLLTDKLFILGAVLGVGSVIAALFVVLSPEQAVIFPMGILASLALVAVAWYKGTRKNAQRRLFLKEVESLEAELAELEKSFEQGGAPIMACMEATGASTIEELKEKFDIYRYNSSLRREIAEQRDRLLGGLTVEGLQEEYQKQQQEIIELEKAVRALAQYAVDTYSIRQDIERIESEMSSAPSWDFGAPALEPAVDFGVTPAGGVEQGISAELGIASRIGGIEMETLVPAVEAAAQRNLAAVTMGKYVRIEAGLDGEPVVHDKHNATAGVSDLSHSTRDLVYFCLRAGLVEAIAGKRRLPFILDDPLAGFDPGRQQAACQILRALGSKTQVILFTSNPALKAAGDVAAELK